MHVIAYADRVNITFAETEITSDLAISSTVPGLAAGIFFLSYVVLEVRVNDERTNPDYGFQTSLREPDQYSKGVVQDPLPPAGPGRARAARLAPGRKRAVRRGVVVVRLACPARWLSDTDHVCAGRARLAGARRALRYRVASGERTALHFRLRRARLRALRRAGSLTLTARARNHDRVQGTPSATTFTIAPP